MKGDQDFGACAPITSGDHMPYLVPFGLFRACARVSKKDISRGYLAP
jgi:hypothetical protein